MHLLSEPIPAWLTACALGVLAVAPWPLYRLLSNPVFRRWHTCHAMRVAGLLLVYVLAVVALALFASRLLLLAAVAAAGLLLAERWRSRPAYGNARRLPPGRLSLVPRDPWIDESFFDGQFNKYGRVFKMSQYFRPMICVYGPRLGVSLLQEHGETLRAPSVRFNSFIPRGFIRYMHADVHDKYRRIFQAALNRRVLDANRALFDTQVKQGLAEMAAASHAPGGVHPSPQLNKMLFGIVTRLFTGLDENSSSFGELERLYSGLDISKAGCGSSKKEIRIARKIAGILQHRAAEYAANSSVVSNSPPCVLSEIMHLQPQAGHDITVLLNLVYMIQIGRSDLTGLFTWAIKMLTENPQWAERMRAAAGPDSRRPSNDEQALAGNIVREVLRLEQSEYLFRKALADIEFEGFVIPKGWLVRICIRDGHRDASVFAEPTCFDADRFRGRNYHREEYSPLGIGRHSCLGHQVIDLVGRLFVTELTTAYDAHCIQDGPRQYGRAHWEPSSDLRLQLKPLLRNMTLP